MRAMSTLWAKGSKDPGNRSQDEVPKESISRSGRIRKLKDVSGYYFGTSRTSSNRATTVKATTSNSGNSKKKVETEATESVAMEAEVAPVETVEETPKPESVKDSKARVNPDLLQKVLSESVEEWFSFSEVIKSNKGKPYKKRKIVLPPMNESDFCFELTQTKDTENKPEDEDSQIDSPPNEETEVEIHQLEESEEEDKTLEINENDKVNNTVINKKRQTTKKSASLRMVNKNVEKEEKEDERVEENDSGLVPSSSKTDEVTETEKETTTENEKNKSYRNFFALILYEDETNGEAMTDSEQPTSSGQQAKTVIKTLNLGTADLKEFEVELGDFSKLPKDSPIFECMSGIERLLQTGATESTPQESQNGEASSVFPKSYKERVESNAEISAALPSEDKKMNLKARERLCMLSKDIMQKYKKKAKGRKNEEAQAVKENTIEEEKADEKKEERREKAKKFKKTESNEMNDEAEPKKKPKKDENVHENKEKEEVNEPIEEKVEPELEKPEMKEKTNKTSTKRTKVTTHKRMNKGKVNKMSAMRCKKRKKLGQVRKLEKLFSYVNTMKRKSGYKSGSESAESLNSSNEEQKPKGSRINQESRVEETKFRRKSRREIKLTPKLVDMIATSHKRPRRSPSIREDSMDDSDYEYPNLLKKVVSGSMSPERVGSAHSSRAIENYSESKRKANSGFEGNWKPGDIVWARFAGSPFWPSLVLRDPFSNGEYTKVKHLGRLLKPFVHLQFFADSGRRAWVPEHYCMSFNGLDEFERKKSNLPKINSFTQRNDLLYQKAFFPKKQIEMSWLVAVIEGETVLKKSTNERINYMKVKYPLVKYAPSATNGQPSEAETVCNGTVSDETASGEGASHSYGTRLRKARSSSGTETYDSADCEASTSQEPSTETDETFECVSPSNVHDNRNGNERDAPKITLKLVRNPKRNEKREWNKSSDNIEGPSVKKPKKNGPASLKKKAKAGIKLGSQKKKVGGKKKEVCEVCLRVLGRRNVIKCNEVCTGVIRRGSRKKTGVKVGRLEEGAAPALKKTKRRRKFTAPRVNKWKEKLRSIFDFYKEYGGCGREGMDVGGVFPLSIPV